MELRERLPDPTLAALEPTLVRVAYQRVGPPVTHLQHRYTRAVCGLQLTSAPTLLSAHAAYFAVVCGDCFPGSPPRGTEWMPERGEGIYRTLPELGWQLSEHSMQVSA